MVYQTHGYACAAAKSATAPFYCRIRRPPTGRRRVFETALPAAAPENADSWLPSRSLHC